MERFTFGKKTSNAQRPRLDRFVAPRDSIPEIRRRLLWTTSHQRGDDFTQYHQRNMYTKVLEQVFSLEPLKTQNPKDVSRTQDSDNASLTWPCIPRKKTHLSSNDSLLLLDLPTYGDAPFPELLDWNNDNILVAALGRSYHMWSWGSQSLLRQGFTYDEVLCCKFDPRGELLLLGTSERVEVHDNERSKRISDNFCRCIGPNDRYCFVTAVDWSPTGNAFATGCDRGVVCSLSRSALRMASEGVADGALLSVKISPDARYVAAVAVNRCAVAMLTWPDLRLYTTIDSDSITKALAWHPWRSALLGIGAAENNIGLWNAHSSKGCNWDHSEKLPLLDAMLFSHRTGELVLSVWDGARALAVPKAGSQLVVMSEPGTVVDQWGDRYGLDRVRTMVFSPDGTKLATATVEEDLIIWNFLPEDKKNKKKKRNFTRFSRMPVYLDEAGHGSSLR